MDLDVTLEWWGVC